MLTTAGDRYVNPIGLKHLTPSWKFYTIYCCWIAVELCVVFWFYIETYVYRRVGPLILFETLANPFNFSKGPTLEEIAKIFDGEDAETGVADISAVKADMRGVDHEDKENAAIHVEAVGNKMA